MKTGLSLKNDETVVLIVVGMHGIFAIACCIATNFYLQIFRIGQHVGPDWNEISLKGKAAKLFERRT
jgi:hypothetical protein